MAHSGVLRSITATALTILLVYVLFVSDAFARDYRQQLELCRQGDGTACWRVTEAVGYGSKGSNYRVSAEAFFMQCEIARRENRKSSDCSLALLELERFDSRLVKRQPRFDCLDLKSAPAGFQVVNKCAVEKDQRVSFDVCHDRRAGQDSIDYFFGRITGRQLVQIGGKEYVCDKRSARKPASLGKYRLPGTNGGFSHSYNQETRSFYFGKNILIRVGMLYLDAPWRSVLPEPVSQKNEITKGALNRAVHQYLRSVSGAADRMFGGNAGFVYSCDGENCTAMGGIVSYRYIVTQISNCSYESDTDAVCHFRMGLEVQSSLGGNATEIGNRLLRGFGASANLAIHQAELRYRNNRWVVSHPPGVVCTSCN